MTISFPSPAYDEWSLAERMARNYLSLHDLASERQAAVLERVEAAVVRLRHERQEYRASCGLEVLLRAGPRDFADIDDIGVGVAIALVLERDARSKGRIETMRPVVVDIAKEVLWDRLFQFARRHKAVYRVEQKERIQKAKKQAKVANDYKTARMHCYERESVSIAKEIWKSSPNLPGKKLPEKVLAELRKRNRSKCDELRDKLSTHEMSKAMHERYLDWLPAESTIGRYIKGINSDARGKRKRAVKGKDRA